MIKVINNNYLHLNRTEKRKNGILKLNKFFSAMCFSFSLPNDYKTYLDGEYVDIFFCARFGGIVIKEHQAKYDKLIGARNTSTVKTTKWRGTIEFSANVGEELGFYEDEVKIIKYEKDGVKMLVVVPYHNGLFFRCDNDAVLNTNKWFNSTID